MLGQHLEPLSIQQQAFLLTLLIFGREEHGTLLEFLPEEEHAPFKKHIDGILQIDREERAKLLINQLMRLMAYTSQSTLSLVHPSWIIPALEKAPPITASCVLEELPFSFKRQIDELVSQKNITLLPEAEFSHLLPEVKAIVRNAFEKQFVPMPFVEQSDTLYFHQLLSMRSTDFEALSNELGKAEIVSVFAHLGPSKAGALLVRYPQSLQDALINELQNLEARESNDERAALCAHCVFSANDKLEEWLKVGGLLSLASAFLPSDVLLVQQFAQRMEQKNGFELLHLYEELNALSSDTMARDKQRLHIVQATIAASKANLIDERFSSCVPFSLSS